jgi:hypothetical protein
MRMKNFLKKFEDVILVCITSFCLCILFFVFFEYHLYVCSA